MTSFERFERQIPELMTELEPVVIPDYFDDMLLQTATHRQRPAWSYLERWLPMGTIAQALPIRTVPWRPILVLAMLLILIAAGLFAYVGSQARLPPPFGPARNGQIVFSTSDGDIVTADATTGSVRTLIGGPELDSDPWFSPDGTKFAFARRINGTRAAVFTAKADGSSPRQLLEPAPAITWFDWSPSGDRFTLIREGDDPGTVAVVDAADGSSTSFHLDLAIAEVSWLPAQDRLIVTADSMGPGGPEHGVYVVRSDGTGLRTLVAGPAVINSPTISPDGSRLAYTTWGDGAEGRTHIIDIESGDEVTSDFSPGYTYTDLSPEFSPDGTKLMVERYDADGYRLTIMPVDGRGPVIPMGTYRPEGTDGARAKFSPDGTKVLATYQNDRSTWLLDVATGVGVPTDWQVPIGSAGSWQRLAP